MACQTVRLLWVANSPMARRYSSTAPSTHVSALFGGEGALASSDLDAGGQPLDIPLPGARQGLVEIVDVEDEITLWGGKPAKVGQVRVTAELRVEAGLWGRGEIRGHDHRRAAVEGEGRGEHAPIANRHEVGDPALRLLLQQLDWIGSFCRWLPGGMALARCFGAGGPADGGALA